MSTTKRESWGGKLGFILAAVGSAVGLANIVRFPYLVGQNGGAAFILLYLICLVVTGFPIFISEVTIGRNTNLNPFGAFAQLGKNKFWKTSGLVVVLTGFIVSSFYSALAGWILGYFFESLSGNINTFKEVANSTSHFNSLISSPFWGVGFHALFLVFCAGILYTGVRHGLEKFSKILMPLMFIVLIALVVIGLSMDNAKEGLKFLFEVNWDVITPGVFLLALGQAFFTLSAGQGTMITYGSYLSKKTNLISSCLSIVLADTIVSLLASIVVFTIVFSVGLEPDSGIGLIFHTLPVVFSKISGGYLLALAFFLLVTLAAITSEISAMEPAIAYLVDEKGFSRHKAVWFVSIGAFIIGIPSALSYSLLKDVQIFNAPILESFDFLCTGVLIPLGGFLAVLLVGWKWGLKNFFAEIELGCKGIISKHKILKKYLIICIKYVAPITIILVAIDAIGFI